MRIGINVKTQSYMYFMNTNDEAKYDAKKKINNNHNLGGELIMLRKLYIINNLIISYHCEKHYHIYIYCEYDKF